MATCNLNVIVMLELISWDLYLLFAVQYFSPQNSKFFFTNARGRNQALNPLGLYFKIKKKKKKKSKTRHLIDTLNFQDFN